MFIICVGVFGWDILYTYKFSRDVIFEVFTVNWPSAKFSSLSKTLAVMCVADSE